MEGAVVEAAGEVLRERRPAAPALRHRRLRGLGRRPALRRRDRRVRGGADRRIERRPQASSRRSPPRRPRGDGHGGRRGADVGASCSCARTARARARSARPSSRSAGGRARRGADVGGALGAREHGEHAAVRGRHGAGAAPGGVRRGGLHGRPVSPRPRGRLAALRVRPALAVRHPRALPRRRGDRGRLARGGLRGDRRHRPRDLRRRCSPTIPSSTTPRSPSRCARTAAYVGAMGSRRAQEKRRERLLEKGLDRGGARPPGGADRPRPRRRRARRRRRSRSWPRSWRVRNGRSGGRLRDKRGRAHPRGGRVIAGLVLAAGAGVRFGATKQLADLHGRPLLEHGLATMAAADLDRLVVVLGSRADEVLGRGGPARRGARGLRSLGRGPVGVAGLRAGPPRRRSRARRGSRGGRGGPRRPAEPGDGGGAARARRARRDAGGPRHLRRRAGPPGGARARAAGRAARRHR